MSDTIQNLINKLATGNNIDQRTDIDSNDIQERIVDWAYKTFDHDCVHDLDERILRFFEEAVELAQSCNLPKEVAHQMIDHIYSLKVGELHQEIGGVIVSLAVLCHAHNESMLGNAETEYNRCILNIEKIRNKQKQKQFISSKIKTSDVGSNTNTNLVSKKVCKHCGVEIELDVLSNQWINPSAILFGQYCFVDEVKGSQLHQV